MSKLLQVYQYYHYSTINLLFIILLVLAITIGVLIWVYRDAEKRGMEAAVWVLIVLLSGCIGWFVYMIVRKDHSQLHNTGHLDRQNALNPHMYIPTTPSIQPRPMKMPRTTTGVPSLFCTSCGTQLDPKAKYCTNCGKKLIK